MRSRCAFTIVELLVSIGMIGLLISLVMPAVQSAREAARRTQCLSNLRQLVLACANHHDAHGAFPETTSGYNADLDKHQNISVHVRLLPFLDQADLFNTIDQSEEGVGSHASPPTSVLNPDALKTHVSVFACPSDRVPNAANSYRANIGVGPAWHGRPENGPPGAFRMWYPTKARDFTDGLSMTLYFSERLVGSYAVGAAGFVPWRDPFLTEKSIESIADAEAWCGAPPSAQPPHDRYGGATWLYSGWRFTWYNHIRTPNAAGLDCENGIGSNGAVTARSDHPGGVNVALGDGAGRFVSDGIDLAVWRAVATRRSAEVVGEF